jgi:Lysine-specific metallo-endopeptidase
MRYELSFTPEPFQSYTEFDELALFDIEQGDLQGEIEQEDRFSSKDCTDTQKRVIRTAFNNALSVVNNASAVLGTVYGKPGTMTQRTRDLLNMHFHTTDRGNVLKIFRTMFRIRRALEEGVKFQCETNCKGGPGQVTWCGYAWTTQWFGGRSDVHLCFDNRPDHCSFSKLSPHEKAATIIHEVAHRHVGVSDKAYLHDRTPPDPRDYTKLTASQAMDNADSYAWFAVML